MASTWTASALRMPPYIKCWGVWPDQDKGKREIKIQNVVRIEACRFALPTPHAQCLNDAGESGMGYMVFEIEYRDGSRTAHLSGCVVNFVRIAEEKTMADVVAVHPHAGRNSGSLRRPLLHGASTEEN